MLSTFIAIIALLFGLALQVVSHVYPRWWTRDGSLNHTRVGFGIWEWEACFEDNRCSRESIKFVPRDYLEDVSSTWYQAIRALAMLAVVGTTLAIVLYVLYLVIRKTKAREFAILVLCTIVFVAGIAGTSLVASIIITVATLDDDILNRKLGISMWLMLPAFCFCYIGSGVAAGEKVDNKPIYYPPFIPNIREEKARREKLA